MKGKTARLAAAAAILVGVLVLTSVFVETNESVVLAGVLEKVEQARAFMYKMDMTMTGSMMSGGKQEMQGTMIISDEYGMKWEMGIRDPNTGEKETTEMYILPDQKVRISLMPGQKKYQRMEFDDDWLAGVKREKNDPRETLKRMMDCNYTELGRREVDGIRVDGFETTDPNFSGGLALDVKVTLWVDVETWLPVLWEIEMKINEQMQVHSVLSDFQWDIPVVASDFEPVIPEDYTALTHDVHKGPSMTEEAALEGLKFIAIISGQYPKKIDLMSLQQDFSALATGQNLTEAGLKLREEMRQTDKEEQVKRMTEMMMPVLSLGMFHMTLVKGKKEPVYYGETVGPDDVDAVLMRWKVSDDQYRVVLGDLSTTDVTPEELSKLEKP